MAINKSASSAKALNVNTAIVPVPEREREGHSLSTHTTGYGLRCTASSRLCRTHNIKYIQHAEKAITLTDSRLALALALDCT